MKARTARRRAVLRHFRWLLRAHPRAQCPPVVLRFLNAEAARFNRKAHREEPES